MKELRDYSHKELIEELHVRLLDVADAGPVQTTVVPVRHEKPATAKEQWPAICAACGASTTVPFKPMNDYPIFCRDCYLKRKKY